MNLRNNRDNYLRLVGFFTVWWQVSNGRQIMNRRFTISRLAACAALLVIACLSLACNRSKSVITVPTESDVVEILDLLAENGVEADAEQTGEETKQWSVVVSESRFGSSEVAQARRVLQDNGLPRPVAKNLDSGNGIVKPESLQKAQLLNEQKAEIERQLRQLPGVVRASVGVAPSENSFRINPAPATASVLIVHKNNQSSFTIPEVQNLVAGGVSGLKPESVTVKVAAQGVRPLPVRAQAARRARNLLAAFAGGTAIVFVTLLAVLVLQNQRQRQQLAALRSGTPANHAIVPSTTEEANLSAASPTAPPAAPNEIAQGAKADW